METFERFVKIESVDEEHGLVFGWAIKCTEGGEPYFDLQDDHIPEESMLKAATDFMLHSQALFDSHAGAVGRVIFAWPQTADVAKQFGDNPDVTGLRVAVKVEDEETLEKVKAGELQGFSIGGVRGDDEEVE